MRKEEKRYCSLNKRLARWSREDVKLLQKLYPDSVTKNLVPLFGRTTGAIRYQAMKSGIRKSWRKHSAYSGSYKLWTQKEIERLKKLFPVTPNAKMKPYFPKRTAKSILRKALKLGLKKEYIEYLTPLPGTFEFVPWTDQRELLKKLYPSMTNQELAEKLGRTKGAIRGQARVMGLRKKGCKPSRRNYTGGFYSKQEIALIKKLYPTEQTQTIAARLGRTAKSVSGKAANMGIKKDPEKFVRPRKPKTYSDEDMKTIRKLWEDGLAKSEIAKIIGRTANSIQYLITMQEKYFGLPQRDMPDPWSDKEDGYLIENYKKMPKKELAIALKRTVSAVENRVSALGIADKASPRWTDSDLSILKKYYKDWPTRKIAEKLGRSNRAIQAKAFKLGLLDEQH